MQHALVPHASLESISRASRARPDVDPNEAARVRRLRSLIALFALYAAALLAVVCLSDGADIGCVLAGIAAHVVYATLRITSEWRDAAWFEDARARLAAS